MTQISPRRSPPERSLERVDPRLRLTIQLVLAARRWRALLDDRLRRIGQSAARMEAMSATANSPSTSSQIDIARRIGIEGATLTRMLDSLEADGLVERVADSTNRRNKRVRLTPAGERVLAEILDLAGQFRATALEGFAPHEIEVANDFLGRFLGRLEEDLSADS